MKTFQASRICWRSTRGLTTLERVDEEGEASEGAQGAGVGATQGPLGTCFGQIWTFPHTRWALPCGVGSGV